MIFKNTRLFCNITYLSYLRLDLKVINSKRNSAHFTLKNGWQPKKCYCTICNMTSYYTIVVLHLRCLQNIVVNSWNTPLRRRLTVTNIEYYYDCAWRRLFFSKFEIIGSQGLFIFVFPFSYQLIIKHSLITDRRHWTEHFPWLSKIIKGRFLKNKSVFELAS